MSYADRLGVPYVVFLGEDEVNQNAVSVKDMTSGEQRTLPAGEAVALIRSSVDSRAGVQPIREPER